MNDTRTMPKRTSNRPAGGAPGSGAGGSAEAAFAVLLRLYGQLQRVMQPYFAGLGISGSQWGVLRALHRAHEEGVEAVRLAELSTRLLIRPPSVTAVVDRLERSGLVARGAAVNDRRARPVRLTGAGHELVGRVLRQHGQRIELLMGGLSPEEQAELRRLLERLEGHVSGLQVMRTGEEQAEAR